MRRFFKILGWIALGIVGTALYFTVFQNLSAEVRSTIGILVVLGTSLYAYSDFKERIERLENTQRIVGEGVSKDIETLKSAVFRLSQRIGR